MCFADRCDRVIPLFLCGYVLKPETPKRNGRNKTTATTETTKTTGTTETKPLGKTETKPMEQPNHPQNRTVSKII